MTGAFFTGAGAGFGESFGVFCANAPYNLILKAPLQTKRAKEKV